jgi:hypothetical protein
MTTDGAEGEWTGEHHNSLVVRHEDPQVAATVKQMIIDKYASRSALLSTVTETRGPGGFRVLYHDGHPTLPDDGVWRMDLEVDDEDAADFADIREVAGDIYVTGKFDAPALTTAGDVYVTGKGHFDAPSLTKSGNVYVTVYGKFDAPALARRGRGSK